MTKGEGTKVLDGDEACGEVDIPCAGAEAAREDEEPSILRDRLGRVETGALVEPGDARDPVTNKK